MMLSHIPLCPFRDVFLGPTFNRTIISNDSTQVFNPVSQEQRNVNQRTVTFKIKHGKSDT